MVVAHSEMRRQSNLERLVDRLVASILSPALEETSRTVRRDIHHARRARKSGDLGEALACLSGVDLSAAPADLASWVYGEWITTVRRHYGPRPLLLYRVGPGKASVLEPGPELHTLRVVAVLGLKWEPGRLLSRRCLRGLAPLKSHGSYNGGVPCSRT